MICAQKENWKPRLQWFLKNEWVDDRALIIMKGLFFKFFLEKNAKHPLVIASQCEDLMLLPVSGMCDNMYVYMWQNMTFLDVMGISLYL